MGKNNVLPKGQNIYQKYNTNKYFILKYQQDSELKTRLVIHQF